MLSKKERVGFVAVDAGIVMIGDPCYTLPNDGSHRDHIAQDWSAFCHAITSDDVAQPFNDEHIATVVQSGYGDGLYPVFIQRNEEGRIMRVSVHFD